MNTKTKDGADGLPSSWPALERPLHVVLLATRDAQPLDVAGPHEIFSLAGRKLREIGENRGRGYVVDVCTIGKGRFITGSQVCHFEPGAPIAA
jgi:hypothetical protein